MVVTLLFAVALAVLSAQQPETMSLLEEPLYPPPVSRAERGRLEEEIAQARLAAAQEPANADAVLRVARAQRALGHVGDALETLTRAIEGPADAPPLRVERGRGFLAIRKFELAQRDFRKAADTLPDAHCDIAFALYLLADYKQSQQEYGRCAQPGMFGYLAARRAGDKAAVKPPIPDDATPRSPEPRLPGSVSSKPQAPDDSMNAIYVRAVEDLVADEKDAARDLLKPLVEKHKRMWMEATYIAAENDYARILKAEPKKKTKKKK